jgi:acetyl-CoA acetyltransferase
VRFEDVGFPLDAAWSSPFSRWQGPAAGLNSLVLAERAAVKGLAVGGVDWPIRELVLGQTVPQPESFYGPPTLAARLGLDGVSGPWIAQACATSVACLHAAAATQMGDPDGARLVIATDRVSNSPQLSWPAPGRPGGAPELEHWALDNFARDPWAGEPMIATAENVARQGGFSKGQLDELTALRYRQYEDALADDREFQRRYMVSIAVGSKRKPAELEADAGVRPSTIEGLAALDPVLEGGVVSYGTQTHPADGAAGFVLTSRRLAAALSADVPLVEILATGFARVAKAEMPKAPVPAAAQALDDAGIDMGDIDLVKTHNPFAVNDLWFAQETGYDLEKMNPYGCSLIYGHPQGPTGARSVIELAHALAQRGGGVGLFTGCAAGDTGAAIVLRVDSPGR